MGNEYEHAEPYYLTSVCQGWFFVVGYEKTVKNKIWIFIEPYNSVKYFLKTFVGFL